MGRKQNLEFQNINNGERQRFKERESKYER